MKVWPSCAFWWWQNISFVNNRQIAIHGSSWIWLYSYFEIHFCLCVFFFCFHYYRLNIVWMALKKQSFISCGNRLFENTSVSNCNEEGNNFLISYSVLYFQGQSDNICDLPFLFLKNEPWLKHLYIIHSLEETLLITGF